MGGPQTAVSTIVSVTTDPSGTMGLRFRVGPPPPAPPTAGTDMVGTDRVPPPPASRVPPPQLPAPPRLHPHILYPFCRFSVEIPTTASQNINKFILQVTE